MHLSATLDYDWILLFSDEELTIIQAILRDDELDEEQDSKADYISRTLDMIRGKIEEDRTRRSRKNKPRGRHYQKNPEQPALEDD